MLNKLSFLSLFLLVITFAVFGHTLHYSFFVFDDSTLVHSNSLVVDASLKNILNVWSFSSTPLIYNVWQFISLAFGTESALPYRFFNIFFHGVNCFLVYIWMREILTIFLHKESHDQGIEQVSLIATLLYLIHPSHVESVVWISSLKEVMATTFALLSFLFYLRNNRKASLPIEILTVVFYCLGMLVHPTIGTLPFVYLWLDLFFYKRDFKTVFYKNSIYLLLLLIAVLFQKTYSPNLAVGSDQSFYIKVVTLLLSLFDYIMKSLVPWDYSFDYMMSPQDLIEKMKVSFSAKIKAIMSCLILWAIILCARKPRFHFLYYSLTIFILLVLVNLGLVGFAFQNISTVADRFLYFPLIGTSLLWAFIYLLSLKRFPSYGRVIKGLTLVYFLFFSSLTLYRTSLWSSAAHLLESSEDSYKSYPLNLSLGTSYLKEKEYDKAIERFKQAYRLTIIRDGSNKVASIAGSEESLSHLFTAYRLAGRQEEGLAFLKEITESQFTLSEELALSLTQFFLSIEDWYEANFYLEAAMFSNPEATNLKALKEEIELIKKESQVKSYVNLGVDFIDQGDLKEAQKYLKRALKLQQSLGKSLDHIKSLLDIANNGKK